MYEIKIYTEREMIFIRTIDVITRKFNVPLGKLDFSRVHAFTQVKF